MTGVQTCALPIWKKKGGKQTKTNAQTHSHKSLTVSFGGIDPIRVRPDPVIARSIAEAPIITQLRKLLEGASQQLLTRNISEDAAEMCLSGVLSMTYQELIDHITSLRVEQIQRLLRPVVQRLIFNPLNHNTFNVPVDPVKLNIPDYLVKKIGRAHV